MIICRRCQQDHQNDNHPWHPTIVALCDQVGRLEDDLASICRLVQRYQPAGSPPPGGLLELATWILGSLSEENKQLRLRERGYLMELRDYGRTVATLRDQIEHLKGQLHLTS